MRHRKIALTITLLTGVSFFLMRCVDKNASAGDDPRGEQYAGSKSCASCHKDVMNSYAHTNHYKTSSPTSMGDFSRLINDSNNKVYYADSDLVKLEEKHSGFFQTYITNGQNARSEQMDIALGSGEKAQTYAYWKNGQLFELPLTYFTARHGWTNSPGYPSHKPYFDRVILSRCFECHGSFVNKTDIQTGPMQVSEKLDRNSIIFGIDCERCHGPAAKHVEFQQQNPAVKDARFISSIKNLPRQRQLDLCASCHSGNDMDVSTPLFAFVPGDTLNNFYLPFFGTGPAEIDVHARQMQLLQRSKCFQLSQMTCTTCHNTHESETNKMDVIVSKCVSCHQAPKHPSQLKMDGKNCVDCHMPLQVSRLLNFNDGTETKSIPYMIRTHFIAVYPYQNNVRH